MFLGFFFCDCWFVFFLASISWPKFLKVTFYIIFILFSSVSLFLFLLFTTLFYLLIPGYLWFLRGDIFSFNFGVFCHFSFHASEFFKNLFVILGLFSVLCVLANFTFQQKNVEIFFMFLAFFCFMFLYYILCFFSFGSFF